MRSPLFVLFVAPALIGASHRAADPCGAHGDATACYAAHAARRLELFGLPPIEARAAAGEQVYRAMVFGRVGNPVVAVEFRRVPGQEPAVAIYRPAAEAETGAAAPAYLAPAPLAEWERIGEAGRLFDRALAPLPPDPNSSAILICGDAWTFVVETSEPSAEPASRRIRRRVEDACDHGNAYVYAMELNDSAARLLPACTALDDRDRYSPLKLSRCARLAGDRAAAALAFNRLEELGREDRPEGLRDFFGDQADLESQGGRAEGSTAAAEVWRRQTGTGDARFFPDRLTGESADRIAVAGHLERWEQQGQDNVLLTAPVTLALVRSPADGSFRIARALIGAFEPARHYCDPDTLAIRCR
jgi:tetratricopeptide (TPR) repeat protein